MLNNRKKYRLRLRFYDDIADDNDWNSKLNFINTKFTWNYITWIELISC